MEYFLKFLLEYIDFKKIFFNDQYNFYIKNIEYSFFLKNKTIRAKNSKNYIII